MNQIIFDINLVGKNYLVIASAPNIIIEVAGELGMIESSSQWLFVLSSMTNSSFNVSSITSAIKEGGNVALAINSTSAQDCSVIYNTNSGTP